MVRLKHVMAQIAKSQLSAAQKLGQKVGVGSAVHVAIKPGALDGRSGQAEFQDVQVGNLVAIQVFGI